MLIAARLYLRVRWWCILGHSDHGDGINDDDDDDGLIMMMMMNTLVEGLCWYKRVEATIVRCHVLVRLERVHLIKEWWSRRCHNCQHCHSLYRSHNVTLSLYYNALYKPLSPRTRLRVEKQGEGKEDLIFVKNELEWENMVMLKVYCNECHDREWTPWRWPIPRPVDAGPSSRMGSRQNFKLNALTRVVQDQLRHLFSMGRVGMENLQILDS